MAPLDLNSGFTDDPDVPRPDPDAKKRKSIWEKLGTWGSPTLPEGFDHAVTYIFPPAHEYPQVVFPVTYQPKPGFMNGNRESGSQDDTPHPSQSHDHVPGSPQPSNHSKVPTPAPSVHEPAPSVHERAPSVYDPAPSVHERAPSVHAPAPSVHELPADQQSLAREPTPDLIPPEPNLTIDPDPITLESLQEQIEHEEEELARYEMLKRVANTPVPRTPSIHNLDTAEEDEQVWNELIHHTPLPQTPRLSSPMIPERQITPIPSIHSSQPGPVQDGTPKLNSTAMTPIETREAIIARQEKEEEVLREKLYKIIETPLPMTPIVHHTTNSSQAPSPPPRSIDKSEAEIEKEREEEELREKLIKVVNTPFEEARHRIINSKYPSRSSTPLPTHTPIMGIVQVEEDGTEIASYAEKISRRIDEAIVKSPFIRSRLMSPLMSPGRSPCLSKAQTPQVSSSKINTPKLTPSSKLNTPRASSTSKVHTPHPPSSKVHTPHPPSSKVPTPRSTHPSTPRTTQQTPKSVHYEDEIQEDLLMPGNLIDSPRQSLKSHPSITCLPLPPTVLSPTRSEKSIHRSRDEKGKGRSNSSCGGGLSHRSGSPLLS